MSKGFRLSLIRAAGYHADASLFFSAYRLSGISPEYAAEEYAYGVQRRVSGLRCDCRRCKVS